MDNPDDAQFDLSGEDARPADPSVSRDAAATTPSSIDKLRIDGEDRAGTAYPTKFGRGWIPVERDIGLPGEGAERVLSIFPQDKWGGGSPAGTDGGGLRDQPLHHAACGGAVPLAQGAVSDSPICASGENGEDLSTHSYRFTPPRRALFLHHLAEQGSVEAACARVRISKQAAYLARRRDGLFRAGWEAALVVARPVSEEALACRALDGVREPVYFHGELVGERVRYDARLLLAHLARLDAAAQVPHAAARAERFDELLALVAGERFAEELADEEEEPGDVPDPLLPIDRSHYVLTRGYELEPELAEGEEGGDPSALIQGAQDRAARNGTAGASASRRSRRPWRPGRSRW
jgi:hypothetical protein